jgi:uncharacterized RDD family membrane protein YckC
MNSDKAIVLARCLAFVIDGLFIALVFFFTQVFVNLHSIVSVVLEGIIYFGYFIGCNVLKGKTLGKLIFNLKVVDIETNGNLSFYNAFKRELIWMCAMVLGYLLSTCGLSVFEHMAYIIDVVILITISVDENNRGIHDKMAESAVIRIK